ncbi:hypothetical protein VKT23_001838 [Stygiomarasmius scandens]|uniref:Uncharacterized protein n=1 Tax=Marasmiellus scandens TaxID=2682957 RepID=A0ABR1K1F6_9AGAR
MSSIHSHNSRSFTLDSSGIAGFFGGEEALSAMATVHLYKGRRWVGWYNSPGSWFIAKEYGKLAKGRFWRGLYPGAEIEPVELFELGGKKTPKFIGAGSGTVIEETSQLGYLLMKQCDLLKEKPPKYDGRKTTPVAVTVASLKAPNVDEQNQLHCPAAKIDFTVLWPSAFPILTSIGTCVACGVFQDWFAFAMILVGILANGLTCLVIGSGKLFVNRVKPAPAVPIGDGVLIGKKTASIIRGSEAATAQVTRGSFDLEFDDSPFYRLSRSFGLPAYTEVGVCCMLLTTQFLVQILFMPQATLFGQIMFLSSFGVSWCFNAFLSSIEKEKMQRNVLLSKEILELDHDKSSGKYILGTRTAMAVFVVLVLKPKDPLALLNNLIPNDTPVWKSFKKEMAGRLEENLSDFSFEVGEGDEGVSFKEDLEKDVRDTYIYYRKHFESEQNRLTMVSDFGSDKIV